jgi:hypothetical protein
MRLLRFVMIWGLVLPWGVQLAVAQEKEPVHSGKPVAESIGRLKDDVVKEASKKIDPKTAKKQQAHPVRWDFEALETRFKLTRFVMREGDVILICEAKAEGIVKESDFRYTRFDEDKKRLATQRRVRLLQGKMRLEEPGTRAGTIKVKVGEEFRVVLDWVPYVEEVRYVVVGIDEIPREPGPPPEAPPGFERPELILDGSEYGRLYPTLADIDGDGKIDLLVGTWDARLLVYRNCGTNARPVYAKPKWLDETVPSANISGVQG